MIQPVNWLPPEILSQIARDVPEEQDKDARTIIPLTYVCRYWRDSIISIPENWTLISTRSRGLVVLSFERAKAAPLKLYLVMKNPTGSPTSSHPAYKAQKP